MVDISDRLRAHMGKAEIGDILPDCREVADVIDMLVKALEAVVSAKMPGEARRIAAEALAGDAGGVVKS